MATSDDVVEQDWLVLGISLRLATTEEGGRSTPLGRPGAGYAEFRYRPNWGLPGMVGADQVGAMVLWLGHYPVALGDKVRAVIFPFAPGGLPLWHEVQPGNELRMFEGARVCGRAVVEWIEHTRNPVPDEDKQRFVAWAEAEEPPSSRHS